MSATLTVFRGPQRTPYAQIKLIELLQLSVGELLGTPVGHTLIALELLPVPDDDPPGGPPRVHNLSPSHGYARVNVLLNDRIIYRHPHTVEELVTRPLRAVLTETDPDEAEWSFMFDGLDLPTERLVIPEPVVQGVTPVVPFAVGEKPTFGIRRVVETPPVGRLANFGVNTPDGVHPAAIKVLLPRALYADLMENRPFSDEVEEGGFLTGRVFADGDVPGTYLVEVTSAAPAEYTGASLLHFTFTGDSFEAIKARLHGGGERLLGWYHTHLFAAAEEMGLSTIDLRLHFTTFRQPWQLAGLVNLDGRTRTLRFYAREDDQMVRCPQWVIG